MGLIWDRSLEKKIRELIIVVSLLFSISLAQTGKTSDAEIAVRKPGIALEQEATKKIEPVFPPIAKAARASGEVKVEVTIDKAGRVISARVLSGHPLLRDAALTAARQWEFKPTIVSSKPAKVIGILIFNFVLDDGRKSEAEGERENLDPSDSVQDDVAERVQLSKIKDVEKAKSNIKRVAPPYVNFEPCGDYLIIASQDSPDAVKMAYYEGREIKKGEGEVRRYSCAFWKRA
jgi:TonB family protein